jgi:hypothetical protein
MRKIIIKKACFSIVALFLFSTVAQLAYSAELPAGTIISKDNVDKIMNDTFEGHTIKGLLTDVVLMQIRDWNLKIKLQKLTPQKKDSRYDAATRKFKETVKYDPATNECSGFQAGKPFPDMTADDPNFAAKLVWRFYYGARTGNTQHYPHSWLFVNSQTGLERIQEWYWLRFYTKGILPNFAKGESPVVNDEYTSKTLFFVTAPFDLKGVGLFTLRYDSPKVEDSWVYVKSVRRTRRLSGGAWIDPIGGTDMLNDDLFMFNARPSWYKGFKMLGKKHVLVAANTSMRYGETIDFNPAAKEPAKAYKMVDLENAPYWNPSNEVGWEPVEVYIIECIPPDFHPYSKKVVYMDARDPVMYMADCYDKAGSLWKFLAYTMTQRETIDGYIAFFPCQGFNFDLKQRHASIFYSRGVVLDDPKITENNVTLGELRKAGG